MNVSVTQENPILVKAEINVPWADVAETYNAALKEIRKNAQIPGFRKGKIPAGMLKKKFKPQILNELSKEIMPNSLEKAIKDHEIKAVGQPRIVDLDLKENDCLSFVAELDVLPEVELKDYKGIEAEKLVIDITDEQVDAELERLITQATKEVEITDRPAQDGETATLSITALDEESGEPITDLDNYAFVVGAEDAHPTLAGLVAELKAGDDYSGVIEGLEEDSFEDWRGKKLKLFLEVSTIKSVEKPVLDDAFAKTKDAEDLEDLKKKTRASLEENATEAEENRLGSVLIGKLVEAYDFPVPDAMVREEAYNLVQQQMMPYMQMMQQQGPDQQRAFVESMMEYSMPQALGKVRSDLILEKIAEDLKLEISEEEITKELEEYLPHADDVDTVEQLRAQMEERGAMGNLTVFLKRRRAIDAVREAADLTMVSELTEPEHDHDHDHDHDHADCDHDHDHDHADCDHDHDHEHAATGETVEAKAPSEAE